MMNQSVSVVVKTI